MLYLLDANVLIDAHRDYYPLSRVPEFWEWLAHHGDQSNIKMPREIWEEVTAGTGDLVDWMKRDSIELALRLEVSLDSSGVSRVITEGYAPDLQDHEIEKLGRDPFLIAYAEALDGDCTIVSTEVSRPSRQRANRHIPDVCRDLAVDSCNTFELTRRLDFRTSWRGS